MRIVTGAVLGYVTGVGVWLLARRLITCHSPQTTGGRSQQGLARQEVQGATRPVAAITQVSMASLGAYVGWRGRGPEQLVAVLVVTGLLVVISLVDFEVRRIPNALCLALVVWAPAQVVWLGQPTFAAAALGMLVGGGLFVLVALARRGAMGVGDVKLAAALGAVLGYPVILQGLFLGVLAGGGGAALLLATGRLTRKDTMAYAPYLALGGWVAWMGSLGLWM